MQPGLDGRDRPAEAPGERFAARAVVIGEQDCLSLFLVEHRKAVDQRRQRLAAIARGQRIDFLGGGSKPPACPRAQSARRGGLHRARDCGRSSPSRRSASPSPDRNRPPFPRCAHRPPAAPPPPHPLWQDTGDHAIEFRASLPIERGKGRRVARCDAAQQTSEIARRGDRRPPLLAILADSHSPILDATRGRAQQTPTRMAQRKAGARRRPPVCSWAGRVQPGISTLLMTWMTPFDCITLGMVIRPCRPWRRSPQMRPAAALEGELFALHGLQRRLAAAICVDLGVESGSVRRPGTT